MNISTKVLSSGKHYIITSIMNSSKDINFFNQLDSLITKKRFELAAELSITENILHMSTYKLTARGILKIINEFINSTKKTNFYEKRNLFEIVKLSNLPKERLDKIISRDLHLELVDLFTYVSRETKFINFDFLILKIADNFSLKNGDSDVQQAYITLRKNIIDKLVNHFYTEERDEKETTLLCWVDRVLTAMINEEILPNEFVLVINKILNLYPLNINLKWKVMHAVNYALLQTEFSTTAALKNLRRHVFDLINQQYAILHPSIKDAKDLLVTILAKRNTDREDFYYLFDFLKITAQQSEECRFYCLSLCRYIISHNTKQNIFHLRFVRKYFIDMLFDIINKPNENIKIKEEELEILISLYHIDTFYSFYRNSIFNKILEILKTINNGKIKLNNKNFYRYCDVLDYIMSNDKTLLTDNIVQILSINEEDIIKIKRYFTLTLTCS